MTWIRDYGGLKESCKGLGSVSFKKNHQNTHRVRDYGIEIRVGRPVGAR